MPRDGTQTRNQIIRAAEQLFAERGFRNVSLVEINTAAGQLNKSALQYHFGSREALLAAILQDHLALEDSRSAVAVRTLAERPAITNEETIGAAVAGILGLLDQGERGRDVSKICCDIATDPEMGLAAVRRMVGQREPVGNPFVPLLRRANPDLPEDLLAYRFHLAIRMAFAVVADRARQIGRATEPEAQMTHSEFGGNLVAMLAAAVGAPCTPTA